MQNSARILGQGMNFPPALNSENRMAWSMGEDNIRQSIRIILSTEPGERLMLPGFGAGLKRFLFEPNIVTTHRLMKEKISRSLEMWEPRIKLDAIDVVADENDTQSVWVMIRYTLVANKTGDQLQFRVQLAS